MTTRRGPDAQANAPPGSTVVRHGKVILGYWLSDRSIAALEHGAIRPRPICADNDRTVLSIRLRELHHDLEEVGREHWPRYLPLVAQTAAGRWKIDAAKEVDRARKKGNDHAEANIDAGAKAVLEHLLISFPECALGDAVVAVEAAFIEPRQFTAASLGKAIGLTDARRTKLDIRTIAPIDLSPAARKRRNATKNKNHKETIRRENGDQPRQEWLAENNVSAICRQLGISRTTFYKRKDKGLDPLTGLPAATVASVAQSVTEPVNLDSAPATYMSPGPVNSPVEEAAEQVYRSGHIPPSEVLRQPQLSTSAEPEESPTLTGGGQASSLPPARLDTVTVKTTREEPMPGQTAIVTMPAEPDGPPASNSAPEYRELAAEFARQYALTGNEAALSANLQRLAEVAVRHGAAKLYEQERIDRDRRNDTFMSFINHPAYPTAYGVVLELAHADRTAEEIRTVLDIIGETPMMDETAGEMAVTLFQQGHAPASVAMHLLTVSGMRGAGLMPAHSSCDRTCDNA